MGLLNNINNQLDQPAQRHPMRWWHIPLLLILIAGTILAYCSAHRPTDKASDYIQNEGSVFGTIYHITYRHGSDMQEEIDNVLLQVDRSLSPFNDQSIISAINNNIDVAVDRHFSEVFALATEVNRNTDGAFDITVAPLVNAWGFGFKNKENVTDSLINSILAHVGMHKVSLEGNRLIKIDSLTMLDCSAIAKGYGVDAVGLYLESKGIRDYMVEIGGEVRLRGRNSKGQAWNIGIMKPIDDPTGQQTELEQILSITDKAMATSGNYRNFYEENGKKYAHTIDPHTGHPVHHNLLSATVITDDCATADAYATSFMVMGLEKAKELLKSHPELQAYLIYNDTDGNIRNWTTSGFNAFIKETK